MVDDLIGHGTVRYEIYSFKSIALLVLVPRQTYRFSTLTTSTKTISWSGHENKHYSLYVSCLLSHIAG